MIFDARRGKIFAEIFARSAADWQSLQPGRLATVAELLAAARGHYTCSARAWNFSAIATEPDLHLTPAESWQPRIEAVVAIGYDMARRGEFTEPDRLVPVYVRKPEAQEKLEGHQSPRQWRGFQPVQSHSLEGCATIYPFAISHTPNISPMQPQVSPAIAIARLPPVDSVVLLLICRRPMMPKMIAKIGSTMVIPAGRPMMPSTSDGDRVAVARAWASRVVPSMVNGMPHCRQLLAAMGLGRGSGSSG